MPKRKCKVTEYTDEMMGIEKKGRGEKRWHYAGFEPDTLQPLRCQDIDVAGTFGKLLANKKAPTTPVTYNGELPVSMTFGPEDGCGAGWYDELGNVFRVGVGTTAWAVLDEVGEVQGARDKAFYYTLVELFSLRIDDEFSRLAAKLYVVYYVNGTMIHAYNLDPNAVIPQHLVSAVIWWRMAVWKQELPHVCITSHAKPVPLPPGSGSGGAPTIMESLDDGDAAYIAGGVAAASDLTIESYTLWEADVGFLDDVGGDEELITVLKPPPFNFYTAAADEPPFTFERLLLVPKKEDVIVIGSSDADKRMAVRWLKPQELEDPTAQGDLALPRERRTSFVAKRALVRDTTRRLAVPAAAGDAQPALVCCPRMILFMQREPLPVFTSEFQLEKDGLAALRPPTTDEILHAIRNDYFSAWELDEAGTATALRHRLQQVLVPADAHRVTVDLPLSLRQLASLVCFLLFEQEGDVLSWSFGEQSEAEQHSILTRLFGTRAVKVKGPRNRTYFKVLMAGDGKRGVGDVQYNLKTGMVTVTVVSHRFNENGEAEAGAKITPACTPAKGKKESAYRFDVVACTWILASKPLDHAALGAKFEQRSALDDFFGMNGTEM